MKNLKACFFFFFLIGSVSFSEAQKLDCKVLKEEINKEYTGKCKNGLAHGKGVAKGKNLYEGNFKKGLPHGKGTLKYSLDEYYIGGWKKGLEHGKGKLYYKINGADSVKVGYWEEGKYIGKKLIPPYKVKMKVGVDRYSFNWLDEGNGATTNRVIIKFMLSGSDNTGITNIRLQNDSGNRISYRNTVGFENISFPFVCRLNYNTPNKLRTMVHTVTFDFVINKPGNWELILNN